MKKVTQSVLKLAMMAGFAGTLVACNRGAPPVDPGAAPSGNAPAVAPAPQPAPSPVPPTPAAPPSTAPPGANAAQSQPQPQYAQVVSVTPVRQVGAAHQVCHDVTITQTAPPSDQHQIAGTAIGAVLGGVLGNQIGSGKGRTLATVAGAVGGGYAGKEVQANQQQPQVNQTVQPRCRTVQGSEGRIIAYDVRYKYNGVIRTVRMDHDPGDRLQVQAGVTAVSHAQ